MKILFLVCSMGSGGAERVASILSNGWVTQGHDVTLVSTFSGRGTSFYTIPKSVDLIFLADLVGRAHKSFATYIQRFFALRDLMKKKKPDVIVSFLPNVNVAAILTSLFLRIPVICTELTDPTADNRSKLWNYLCRMLYPFANVIVVQTEAVAKSITTIYPHLKLIHNLSGPLPEEIQLMKRSLLEKERKTLLSLGRLVPEKQVDKIILSFASLADKNPDWDLIIYGEGPSRDSLTHLISQLNLNHRIFLRGNTSKPWEVMALADIFVMASVFEGLPCALIEAMGVGLPCVVFDCPSGPKEITRDGCDAFLVPFNDMALFQEKINELMQNESLRISLGDQARKSIIERFNLNKILIAWEDLFKDIGIACE